MPVLKPRRTIFLTWTCQAKPVLEEYGRQSRNVWSRINNPLSTVSHACFSSHVSFITTVNFLTLLKEYAVIFHVLTSTCYGEAMYTAPSPVLLPGFLRNGATVW